MPIRSVERLVSLDALRGLAIAAMIVVNNPGSWNDIYSPLRHAQWNGWTPTDLIFPFFLFIVGAALTLSFASRVERGATRGSLALRVVRRAVIIFAIGIFLNAFPDFSPGTLRIMGVLQRIALCYLAAGLVYLWTDWFAGESRSAQRHLAAPSGAVRSIRNLALVAALVLGLLAVYWVLLRFVPVPGYGAGHLEPQANLAAYIDRAVFGRSHLWAESLTWDPEGLLSTLPAIATTLIGVLAGGWLQSKRSGQARAAGLLMIGVLAMITGEVLNPFFPINKNLWTSTFAIFTAGFAMVFLGIFYWLIDVRGYRRWTSPLLIYGRNAIVVYSLASLLATASDVFNVHDADGDVVSWHAYVYDRFFAPLGRPAIASLLFAMAFGFLWLALLWPLYRRRIFIRI